MPSGFSLEECRCFKRWDSFAGWRYWEAEQSNCLVLLNCDVFGTVSTQWSVQEARGYRDAKFLENDTIIAACNMYKDTVGFLRVQKISNGTVDWESESMQNLMGIFPTDDSYFVSCQRDGKSAMIQKRSAQGEILWQADWDEPISISGILPGEQQLSLMDIFQMARV